MAMAVFTPGWVVSELEAPATGYSLCLHLSHINSVWMENCFGSEFLASSAPLTEPAGPEMEGLSSFVYPHPQPVLSGTHGLCLHC